MIWTNLTWGVRDYLWIVCGALGMPRFGARDTLLVGPCLGSLSAICCAVRRSMFHTPGAREAGRGDWKRDGNRDLPFHFCTANSIAR